MNIIENIKHFIATHALIERNDTIIVGLSGGPDSVFLLHILVELSKEIPITLIVAHLNHEWRQEAHQEQLDCQALAEKFNIPFVTAKISELTLPFKRNGSKEEYARKARRYFFEKTAHEHNANSIALAHHLHDQEETFFIRLIRGSSLTGLTAIKPRNGLYVRPLLETHKSEILDWLHTHNITYAVDASNDSQDYLRNRIRSTVLPALRECDNRFEKNFLTTFQRLQETELFLEKLTATTFAAISFRHITTNSTESSLCARPEPVEGCLRALKDTILTQAPQASPGYPSEGIGDGLSERGIIHESGKFNPDVCYIINIPMFLALDPILQHRVILHWLIAENVPFPITQAFLDEIIRFLSNPRGGTHTIHEQWKIVKKQKKASLIKI
jgi:tRNA(Ile)-lysidine synthetase-like protein